MRIRRTRRKKYNSKQLPVNVIIDGTPGQLTLSQFKKKTSKLLNDKPEKIKGDNYFDRIHVLHDLGFNDYQEYLISDLWRTIKIRQFKRYPYCRLCNSKANQVHHKKYDFTTLSGHSIRSLVSLCKKCHEFIEYENNEKLSLKQANKKLKKAILNSPRNSEPYTRRLTGS